MNNPKMEQDGLKLKLEALKSKLSLWQLGHARTGERSRAGRQAGIGLYTLITTKRQAPHRDIATTRPPRLRHASPRCPPYRRFRRATPCQTWPSPTLPPLARSSQRRLPHHRTRRALVDWPHPGPFARRLQHLVECDARSRPLRGMPGHPGVHIRCIRIRRNSQIAGGWAFEGLARLQVAGVGDVGDRGWPPGCFGRTWGPCAGGRWRTGAGVYLRRACRKISC